MVDVKLTETNLPWFLKAAQFVPFINAHARVSIVQADASSGALPVGVPDPRPARARVTFIDETTGAVLGERNLTQVGDPDSPLWDNSGDPLHLTVDRANIGTRVALSSTTAGPVRLRRSARRVLRQPVSNGGVLHIRGWSERRHGHAGRQPDRARRAAAGGHMHGGVLLIGNRAVH